MKSLLTASELANHFSKAEFVLKTQRQIAKDFGTVGLTFPASFEQEPLITETILSLTQARIEEISERSHHDFMQLIYQIDIPETLFLELQSDPDFIANLTEAILQREAYKVYLRSLF